MSTTLALAADFIERMSNPAYGIRTNEEYALRFAMLLDSEQFGSLMIHEAKELSAIDTLTPHGWLWFLRWAQSQSVPLNHKVLLDVIETWSSVLLQASAIDVGTQDTEWTEHRQIVPLEEFNHPFLRELLLRSIRLPETEPSQVEKIEGLDEGLVRTSRAEGVLVALLQVGREITLDAATTLLHHRWMGQFKLVNYFWLLWQGLDAETQEVWNSRLRPPQQSTGQFR